MIRITWLAGAAASLCATLTIGGCEQPAPASLADARPAVSARDKDGMESQALRVVVEALTDPDPRIRANAVEVVALTHEVLLMPKVQRLLRDPVVPVRFLAAVAVGDLEYALARNEVTQLLNDSNPNVKIAAAYALMKLGAPDSFKIFRNAITSEDQTVRANAALLLGKSGRKDAARFLYWALRDDASADKVVLQAAESIAMLGDDRIYPKLWTRLISAYADDRVLGIRAMGALGTEEAKNALVTMLDDPVLEVRLSAAAQLGKLGEPIGEPEVLHVFQGDALAGMDPQGQQRVKVLTALAIGEIGSKPLTRHLPQLLADPSRQVRLATAKAVLQSGKNGR